jgi:amino acid adenylation domain-containing protein/non-ribosomal peptide synthase protein (TIGR01720 family)
VTDLERLVTEIAAKGVTLVRDGDALRVRGAKGALTSELTDALRRHKSDILALLSNRAANVDEGWPIPRRNGRDAAPLSFAQRRLWFLDQLEGADAIYHIPACARLDGPLDVEALRQSLTQLARRHESLRTIFAVENGEPVQRLSDTDIDLQLEDLSSLADSGGAAERRAASLARMPFDLERGPLVRGLLMTLGPEQHVLALSLHHIVADAWSMSILLRELGMLYEESVTGRPALLTPLPIQYADFSAWQRERLQGERAETLLAYWRTCLRGAPELLELPLDRPRPAVQSFRGAMERFTIDGATVASIRDLAQQSGATLFQVLLAVFQALLSRYSGQDSIVVGSPVANRARAELEPLVGFFVNALVLRADLSGDPTFVEILERVKRASLEAYAHQELPFEMLVADLAPERSLSHNPLFQVMFALQNAPAGPSRLGDVAIAPLDVDLGVAKFDLYLSLQERPDGTIAGEWEFATALFDAATIRRMIGHFLTLAAAAAAWPHERLSRLPLMGEDERRRIAELSRTSDLSLRNTSIVEMVAEQVARTPEAVAVVDHCRRLTYAELDQQSTRLACRLRHFGVGPETLVGICLERSCDIITAVLAVLKAGGAYVPLDPAYPSERIAFVVADAAMPLIVTQAGVASQLPSGPRLVLVDAARGTADDEADTAPLAVPTPGQLAYVIYTSGSTGRPKGILIEHRNAASLLAWAQTVFQKDDLRGTLASTSLSFDLSVFEMFLPLVSGGTVIVAENALALPHHPAAADVTLVNTVPSAIAELIRSGGIPRSVRVVALAGEPLSATLVDRLYALGHIRDVYDLYGPGETTTYSTMARRSAGARESIGRPIANTTVHILDGDGRTVPIGVRGEIYIGGAGVTRGYLNSPELTRERYLAGLSHEGRLYRTGDFGRFWPDGEIQFLGRRDNQVKVRGFRIELGEIEAILSQHPEVRECVVEAVAARGGETRLVAYVAGPTDMARLRAFLHDKLPPFMVPSTFVAMERLPSTPNGKIDRKALPAPDPERLNPEDDYVPASSAIEKTLCGIWCDVLRRERVGLHENFFQIGGDSILAVQIVSRARDAGLRLSPSLLFRHQTVAELSAAAESAAQPAPIEEDRLESGTDVPLTPIQQWCLAGDPPEPHHFSQWVLLNVPLDTSADTLHRALEAVIDHHDAFRLRFARGPMGWRQLVGPTDPPGLTIIGASAAPDFNLEQEIAGLHSGLDLEHGPLVRAALVRRPDAPPQLLIVAHHLIIDGVSWRIVCADLVAATERLRAGDAPVPDARTTSFAAWATRLVPNALSPVDAAVKPMPRDFDEVTFGTYGDRQFFRGALGDADTRTLVEALARAYRARIDDALLAALAAALTDWTGQHRHVVDVEGHGRDVLADLDVSRTVGWFTSLRSLELVAAPGAAAGTLLKSVKQAHRATVRTAAPYRRGQEISFNYLGQLDSVFTDRSGWSLADAGLSASPRRPRSHLLAVTAVVRDGQLSWEFEFSDRCHRRSNIEQLARKFEARLHEMLAHCAAPSSGGYTPSDFPDVAISQADLDALIAAGGDRLHRNIEEIRAASPTQQGILFQAQLAADPETYMTQACIRLEGAMDLAGFRMAWNDATVRHAALRSCFVRTGSGDLLQVTLQRLPPPFVELDWRRENDPESRLRDFLTEDRRRGIAIAVSPLTRLTLVRLGDQSWACVWTFHHALLDGWSLAVILRDVGRCYSKRISGAVSLPSGPLRRAEEMREVSAPPDEEAAEAFWRQELSGWSDPLNLPLDRPAPGGTSLWGEHRREIGSATAVRVRDFARHHRLTLYTMLQGAWAVLLSRYCDRDDILFGGVVSGRSAGRSNADSRVGLFIETVPVRAQVRHDVQVATWLGELQQRHLEREAHAHLPLLRIQQTARPHRRAPFFETLLVLENYPVDEQSRHAIGNLVVKDVRVCERPAYPLTLIVQPAPGTGERLTLTAVYDARRFSENAVATLVERFEHLLASLAETAQRTLAEVSLPDADEARRILVEWNATGRPYPINRTVVDAFEEQVARTPDATAVVAEEEAISYAELDQRSNRLAHVLRAKGVGPEVLVGVSLERSVEMVVALYGILKAGGAYVPIDPAYPAERRQFMRRDAALDIVLDREAVRAADGPATPLVRTVEPETLAYLIYTSGSTGTPKGALNTHVGLMNRLLWMQETFALDASDAVLQKTPFSFDVSVWEFFWPLMFGARIVVARPGGHLDPGYLLDVIERRRITTLHFVPSMLRVFLDAEGLARCRPLRRVITSGEALSPDLVDRFHSRIAADLHNLYGPTEAAVDVTWWPCPRHQPVATVPIGRPIANTQIYILDRHRRPVPAGVPGELHIGGVQVGRGYWRRPDLTAERFVANPFGAGRLYRTGDVGRFLPDGSIEYLGRTDHQVKIRGVRIELGEIEAALRDCPQVRDAVVTAREDGGDQLLVAYCTPRSESLALAPGMLRQHLRSRLPESMVPSLFVACSTIPLLPNGKVDRQRLPVPQPERLSDDSSPRIRSLSRIEQTIREIWRDVLRREDVGVDENFFDIGGHSLRMVRVHGRLQDVYGPALTLLDLFEHPTIRTLGGFLAGRVTQLSAPAAVRTPSGSCDIAVIGMACRFPGAATVDDFWRNLVEARHSIRTFTDEELLQAGENPALLRDPRYVRAYGALSEPDRFDAAFFDISPREAEIIDPQQRVLLEVAWEALERAGYDPSRTESSVGVFAGAGMNSYALHHLHGRRDVRDRYGAFPLLVASDKDHVPTRVSYKLNLTGPSVNVQTACSTSLVAIYFACESLIRGDCDMALAGGVTIRFPQTAGYVHEEGMIFSPDGRCRAFDANAAGMVAGSGAGIVVLKRLDAAVADGDHIHAVVKGLAINNDGAVKVGYTAPSVEGQARVIGRALQRAGVSPETIRYVEAHGTGTPVGDPIEVAALTRAWRASTARTGYCAIGSVKTNVGHLDAAAGVAGFIKATLAVEHGIIPPSLHFNEPNPQLKIESTPFTVAATLTDWPADGHPRRAAVSSFGIGGTNAHAVLEEAPTLVAAPLERPSRPWHVLPLSARTSSALETTAHQLADALERAPGLRLQDVAYTLIAGRRRFSHRRALVCRDRDSAIRLLRGGQATGVTASHDDTEQRPVIFMFSGHGAQYPGMGRGVYDQEPVFRQEIDRCSTLLKPHLGRDVRDIIFGDDGDALRRMSTAQPAMFVLQYALAQLWMSWGVKPVAMIGHSAGEYVAACLAGVFSLDDALALIATRGRLIERTAAGGMVAVALAEGDLVPRLHATLSLAVVTAPGMCVVSGPLDSLATFRRELEADAVDCQSIDVEVAAHSTLVEPVLGEFREAVERTPLRVPEVPFASNVSGTWIGRDEATDAAYWTRHLRQTVRFGAGIEVLLGEHPTAALLEIGPGRSLTAPVLRHPARHPSQPVVATVRRSTDDEDDGAFLLTALAQLWTAGVQIDAESFHAGESRHRVPLPTYPFDRKRYCIDAAPSPARAPARKQEVADWLYLPTWQRSALVPEPSLAGRTCLLFADEGAAASSIEAHLKAQGCRVAVATPARMFAATGDRYTLDPADREHYDRLFRMLSDRPPDVILHLWSMRGHAQAGVDDLLDRGFHSLLFLTQALAARGVSVPTRLAVVTAGAHRVVGNERLQPLQATVLGPVRVAPQEIEQLSCVQIDLASPDDAPASARYIVSEAYLPSQETAVAYRNGLRWIRQLAPLTVAQPSPPRLRDGGTYLIVGGFGGIGLELAEEIARSVAAPTLILVARSRGEARHAAAVERLRAANARVHTFAADIADREAMRGILERTRALAGPVLGIVHAAGIAGGGTIALRTRESVDLEFASKIRGTLVLHEVFSGEPLDFFFLCSSTVAITGGFGSVAYTAANAFVDAFAEASASRNEWHESAVMAVNWDRWQGVGMAVEIERLHHTLTGETLDDGIERAEGRAVFRRLLGCAGVSRVAVSPRDFEALERDTRAYQGSRVDARQVEGDLHERPEIGVPYRAPATATEETVAAVWGEVLGIERVGVDDNFVGLGGDSLVAVRIVSRLRRQFDIALPLRTLYEIPTVGALSRHIEAIQWARESAGQPAATDAVYEAGML